MCSEKKGCSTDCNCRCGENPETMARAEVYQEYIQRSVSAASQLQSKTEAAAVLSAEDPENVFQVMFDLFQAMDAYWDEIFIEADSLRFALRGEYSRNALSGLGILNSVYFNPERREFWILDSNIWRNYDECAARKYLIGIGLSPVSHSLLGYQSPVDAVIHSLTHAPAAKPPFDSGSLVARCDNCIYFDSHDKEGLEGTCRNSPPPTYQYIVYPWRETQAEKSDAEREQDEIKDIAAGWLTVDGDHSCKDFKPKEIEVSHG